MRILLCLKVVVRFLGWILWNNPQSWNMLKGQLMRFLTTAILSCMILTQLGPLFILWSIFLYSFDFTEMFIRAKNSAVSTPRSFIGHRGVRAVDLWLPTTRIYCTYSIWGNISTLELSIRISPRKGIQMRKHYLACQSGSHVSLFSENKKGGKNLVTLSLKAFFP